MRIKIELGIGLSVLFTCVRVFAWTDLTGGDHGGSSWVITNGTYIASNHFNIGTVMIATGTTVYVKPYDGSKYGWVEISASNITILGTLDASGAGYLGGNGGSGGSGSSGMSGGGPENGRPGAIGVVGSGGYGGSSGSVGYGGYITSGFQVGGNGGVGGLGGYAISGGQGDSTTNELLSMGSGGGGGGGGGAGWKGYYDSPTSGGGGGGAGNRGGGYIKLLSENYIIVRGAIFAKGCANLAGNGSAGQTAGFPGSGGSGGVASVVGQSNGGSGGASVVNQSWGAGYGGHGGSGAGGGVLLNGMYIDLASGIIDTLGGGGNTTNGGTLKIFYNDHHSGTYSTGRTYLKQLAPPEPGTVFEF